MDLATKAKLAEAAKTLAAGHQLVNYRNTLYMPQIPFKDDEALALASFIATLNLPSAPAATQAKAQAATATIKE